jgi:hypothetical protein
LLAPGEFELTIRLPAAFGVAVLIFAAVWLLFRRLSWRAAVPEKHAIRDAARIEDFSWRITTFTFQGDAFTERFCALNESIVVRE